MNIEVRNDAVLLTGYVNAVERLSKPIKEKRSGGIHTFLEKIKAGVFRTALKRADDVKILLNHDVDRVIASTKDGTAKLEEDSIGLRAEINITDAETVQKAKEGKLTGWSFGFVCNADEKGTDGEYETRTITDLDLMEVSVLDDRKTPAYYGTLIETRSEDMKKLEIRVNEDIELEQPAEEAAEEKTTEEEASEVGLKDLANAIADIIIEKLNSQNREAEEPAEEEPTEEAPAEEETDEEERAIDYSAFEERIAKLTK